MEIFSAKLFENIYNIFIFASSETNPIICQYLYKLVRIFKK